MVVTDTSQHPNAQILPVCSVTRSALTKWGFKQLKNLSNDKETVSPIPVTTTMLACLINLRGKTNILEPCIVCTSLCLQQIFDLALILNSVPLRKPEQLQVSSTSRCFPQECISNIFMSSQDITIVNLLRSFPAEDPSRIMIHILFPLRFV